MGWSVVCLTGEVVPNRLRLDGEAHVGRDPHCDLRLRDDSASRYHARIEPTPAGVVVTDNRSRNGVLVDGQRVERVTLGDGGIFACGQVTFLVEAEDGSVGDTRILTDAGAALAVGATTASAPWQEGDDPRALALVHALCRVLATTEGPSRRAARVCALAGRLVSAPRTALVRRGAVLAGDMSPRLAARLAGGRQARLLVLGEDLVGSTIAAEAVGSAASAPIGDRAHLVVARTVEAEPLDRSHLRLLALLAAEVAPWFGGEPEVPEAVARLRGVAPVMVELRRRLGRCADSDATVLVTGESGTGKELVAQALHQASGRAGGPFVAVNCAAVAATLFEAELFGHERGAFTGAEQARAGRIRAADGGTLFLDEVGELPAELQAKLLRVLQEGTVEPVGGTRPVAVNVRVVAATNRDLRREVEAGRFRDDLFYRLDVLRLHTPALRDHASDIPELADYLLAGLAEELGRPPPRLGPAAAEHLARAPWPGNVRQLLNTLRRAAVLADEEIAVEHLELEPGAGSAGPVVASPAGDQRFPTLAEVEARHVAAALARTAWNKTAAARLLAVSRPTILRKIAEYGLQPPA